MAFLKFTLSMIVPNSGPPIQPTMDWMMVIRPENTVGIMYTLVYR